MDLAARHGEATGSRRVLRDAAQSLRRAP